MSKVNIEGFIEVECPILNEHKIVNNELNQSPELKVQIFLDNFSSDYQFTCFEKDESRTKIICPKKETDGRCMYTSGYCLYKSISKKD